MLKSPKRTSVKHKTPLASIECLKYIGIVGAILSIYVLCLFYYHYADDFFTKSLSVGQYHQVFLLCIGSQLVFILLPLLFFSGALVYHSVRKKGINPFKSLTRDLIVILPLGILIWFYGAFWEAPVNSKFHAMIFETQQLKPGEKLEDFDKTARMMESPNLTELSDKIDILDNQIADLEKKFVDRLARIIPSSELNKTLKRIDFGTSSIKPEDVRNSTIKWDGLERDVNATLDYSRSMVNYISTIQNQQSTYQDQINTIYLNPVYLLLFLVFGVLLGYLIRLHKAALTAILIAIAFIWYYAFSILNELMEVNYSNQTSFILTKIGVLVLLNLILLVVIMRVSASRASAANP